MPRTAVTLAKTHKGEWKLLAHPDVSIVKQLQDFRSILGERSHKEFSLIQLQESDGHVRQVRLRSLDEQKAHDDLRADELKKAKEASEVEAKAEAKRKKQEQKARDEAHKAELERLEKQIPSKPETKPETDK
jgi:hypothetical protein